MYIPNNKRSSGDQINEQWLVNPTSDVADWRFRNDIPITDWMDQILQNAFTHSHQVSVSSKGKRYSIYLSAGYLNHEGIVKNTGFERFNFRLNASVDLNKYIKAGATFAPTISHQDKGESEGKDKQIMTRCKCQLSSGLMKIHVSMASTRATAITSILMKGCDRGGQA